MIPIKSARELAVMKESGQLLGSILAAVEKQVKPGVTTGAINAWIEQRIADGGARPSFKGYRGFPAAACISVNEEVVHGIPSYDRVLKDGDIVGIDVGTCLRGYHADAARTFPVGAISSLAKRLIESVKNSFFEGISVAVAGGRVGDIGHAVQSAVERDGFSVVRALTGHGIGGNVHEEPDIPNFGKAGKGPRLRAGMVLAVEPMVNAGGYEVKMLNDGWTIVTEDASLSAHYENTIAVTEDGPPLILTLVE
jgi:methionyl aminopeptidase